MKETFRFGIGSELFNLVPGYSRIVVVASRKGPGGTDSAGSVLSSGVRRCQQRLEEAGGVTELPEVQAWRTAFRAVGFDPTRTRPAVEALTRRAAKGDPLALGNPLIDIGTGVSLQHGVPVGMHTLDDVVEPLVLDRAGGQEKFVLFNGKTETPDAGEWVYRSGNRVLTRRWVWKQGAFGSISDTNVKLAVNLDLIDDDHGSVAVEDLDKFLVGAGFEVVAKLWLRATSPSGEWP